METIEERGAREKIEEGRAKKKGAALRIAAVLHPWRGRIAAAVRPRCSWSGCQLPPPTPPLTPSPTPPPTPTTHTTTHAHHLHPHPPHPHPPPTPTHTITHTHTHSHTTRRHSSGTGTTPAPKRSSLPVRRETGCARGQRRYSSSRGGRRPCVKRLARLSAWRPAR